MSFFDELKRRNVFKVGIAYVVVAWLVAQVLQLVFESFGTPDWVMKTVLVLLATGAPFAIFFAWAFEMTPEGLKRESEVDRSQSITHETGQKLNHTITAVLVLTLGYFAYDKFVLSTGRETAAIESAVEEATSQIVTEQTDTTEATSEADNSIAVLPFENISQDASNEPFTIGIHDDLLTQISKVSSLRTISRTSVMQYKDSIKPLSQVASELGVSTILEGSVQRAGDLVRINVLLIDAKANRQLWAERFERQLTATNIFAIQSDIVMAIADSLKTALSSREKVQIEKVPTDNLAALEFYFLGRQAMELRLSATIEEAIEYFQNAIDLDPDFALAYIGLSDSYQLQEDSGGLTRSEMYAKAEPALEKALELDSQLGPAYTSLGGLNVGKGDYVEAEAMFKKSIELSPNYPRAYLWYGLLLVDMGRMDEAIAIYEKGIERDPLSSQLSESLGTALAYQGRYDEALKRYQKSTQINSTVATSYINIGKMYWTVAGSISRAVACHRKGTELDSGDRLAQTFLGLLFLDIGDAGQAEHWIEGALQLAPDSLEPQSAMAVLDQFRGNEEGALKYAEAAQQISPYYPDARLLQTLALSILRNKDLRAGEPEDALQWYEEFNPELFVPDDPIVNFQNYRRAIDLAYVLQQTGDLEHAQQLLNRALAEIQSGKVIRLGFDGYGIADVQIYALQGDERSALAALRQAIDEGWRGLWWFYLKNNPNLSSLQSNVKFQVMVLELETFMSSQQATLSENDICTVVL